MSATFGVGQIDTEIVLDGRQGGGRKDSDLRPETQRENLREVVRALVREEFERYLRTEAQR